MIIDRTKSLEELEGEVWREPKYDSSLVRSVHSLRRKPLRDLTTEDLRVLLGQGTGAALLLDLAIERLEADPFASGDFYPGDLLATVVRFNPAALRQHSELLPRIRSVAARALQALERRPDAPQQLRADLASFIAEAAA